MTFQFHITGRCNLHCKHCYRPDDNSEILSFQNIIDVLLQFEKLADKYNHRNRIKEKPHVNLTGGEPLMREDIYDILDYIGEHRNRYTCGILTNGSPINEKMIASFIKNRISFIQLSIDGNCDIHNSIRAPGDYERTFETIKLLNAGGIRTMISFTANEDNYRCLPEVALECRKHGVNKLWSDRMVPIGSGEGLKSIDKKTLIPYLLSLQKAQQENQNTVLCPNTEISMERALQFLVADEPIYSCSAGISLITVDEYGKIYPCRRMPIACGNALDHEMEEVYFNHKIFQKLRKETVPQECSQCKFQFTCRGGARCQSYAVYGDFTRADPACPLSKPLLPDDYKSKTADVFK